MIGPRGGKKGEKSRGERGEREGGGIGNPVRPSSAGAGGLSLGNLGEGGLTLSRS